MKCVSLMTVLLSVWTCHAAAAIESQEERGEASSQQERIVTKEEVREVTHPAVSWPLRVVFYPFHLVNSGMESGLISFEKHSMRERLNLWTETLRQHGISAMIGGLGFGAT